MAGFDESNLLELLEIGKTFHKIGSHEAATPELVKLAVQGIEQTEAIVERYKKELQRFRQMTQTPFATKENNNG